MSSSFAQKVHSITFRSTAFGEERNTWDDWHLVPVSRPVINPPAVHTHYIDIPGANGSIDLTDTLTGGPTFGDREGSIEFMVLHDYDLPSVGVSQGILPYSWKELYSELLSYFHGRKRVMALDDDPTVYYIGRMSVNNWKTDQDRSTIAIDYRLDPYTFNIITSYEFNGLFEGPELSIATERTLVDDTIDNYDTSVWTVGQIAVATGNDLNSTDRRLRTGFLSDDVIKIRCPESYEIGLYFWNKNSYTGSTGYVGGWTGSELTKSVGGTAYINYHDIRTIKSKLPQAGAPYRVKAVVRHSPDRIMDVSDSENVIFTYLTGTHYENPGENIPASPNHMRSKKSILDYIDLEAKANSEYIIPSGNNPVWTKPNQGSVTYYFSYTIPIPKDVSKIHITPNSSYSAITAFLKTYDPDRIADGEPVDFSDGYYQRNEQEANSGEVEYDVTSGMNYIYILLADDSKNDHTPTIEFESDLMWKCTSGDILSLHNDPPGIGAAKAPYLFSVTVHLYNELGTYLGYKHFDTSSSYMNYTYKFMHNGYFRLSLFFHLSLYNYDDTTIPTRQQIIDNMYRSFTIYRKGEMF